MELIVNARSIQVGRNSILEPGSLFLQKQNDELNLCLCFLAEAQVAWIVLSGKQPFRLGFASSGMGKRIYKLDLDGAQIRVAVDPLVTRDAQSANPNGCLALTFDGELGIVGEWPREAGEDQPVLNLIEIGPWTRQSYGEPELLFPNWRLFLERDGRELTTVVSVRDGQVF